MPPPPRLPPLPALLAFEAVARLRSVTRAGEELAVTPSAVSHRIRQLETQLGAKLFTRDFGVTNEGVAYLARVREALVLLQQVPARDGSGGAAARLRVAVTPTFSRALLMPRLSGFRYAYPGVDLVLQVAIPYAHVLAEEADIEVRFGPGPITDRDSVLLLSGEVAPVCSPEYLHEAGPFDGFDSAETIERAKLLRSPMEPWRTWFRACGIARDEPAGGAQFNDIGLLLDAAAAGFGVALMRLDLGAGWLATGRLVRLSQRSVRSPHHYFVCWKPGALDRWECAAFVDWLQRALGQEPAGGD
jgi:LysR family glycine cleavage system transcriptional activator